MKEYRKPVLTCYGKIIGSDIPLEDFILPMPSDPDRPIIGLGFGSPVLPDQDQDEQSIKDKLFKQPDPRKETK